MSFSLGYSGFAIYDNLATQIKTNKEIAQSELDFRFYHIEQKIDELQQEMSNKIDNDIKKLDNKIIELPNVLKSKKIELEERLKKINVMILNKSSDSLGSGVTIKYNGQYYILSAGHMVDNDTDNIILMENGNVIGELEVVKKEYTFNEKEINGNDLTLFRPKNKNLKPRFYVELANAELTVGNEIYIVGNPLGMEDVVSDGRIAIYEGNFMYYIDHTYFGNSGGGVYTRDGKLLGIVSHLVPIQPYSNVPPYMIHGAVRLNEIKNFLRTIE
jgi:S1-C subfamily serine protease